MHTHKGIATPAIVLIVVVLILIIGLVMGLKSSAPSEFDGQWQAAVMPSGNFTKCGAGQATVQISGKKLTGMLITTTSNQGAFTATVSADGTIAPGSGTAFNGTIVGSTGSGTWSDAQGCSGSFVINKFSSATSN